ncbi:MAG: histidine kinase dimerization/phosphoacceptor domain -containing protein [Nitrospira sp.]|nr:histidine kinase dimerization/phosphoacceptor domain -containing protein [Nitrospira sp.]
MSARPRVSYLIALLATVVAVAVRHLLDYFLGTQFNFLLPLIVAVMVAAWHGGLWCGLFATLLNMVVSVAFAVNTDDGLLIMPSEWERISLFAGVGIIISSLSESLHQQRHMAEVAAAEAARRWTELKVEVVERQEAESKARQWESVFNKASWAVAVTDPVDDRFKAVNPAFAAMHCFTIEDLLGRSLADVCAPQGRAELLTHLQTAHQRTDYVYESLHVRRDGTRFPCVTHMTALKDAHGKTQLYAATFEDITERKQNESRLRASLKEKEILLKEIHHRVKNNLQIISSLLDLQSDHTQDRQAQEMFKESQGRVRSMALIHERLYRSRDLARVPVTEYVEQLAHDLYRAYKVSDNDIVLHVEAVMPPLPLDMAIPCGLLLNELLSNCLKHGFKDAEQGWIRVTWRGDGPSNVLTVADNGAGFPTGLTFGNATSFGLQLVNTLVEQLEGKIELVHNRGTVVTITFPGSDRSQEEPT